MKTPMMTEEQNAVTHAEMLHLQYLELNGVKTKGSKESKRSSLLTPLLLAIPVIVILIILLSALSSGNSNTLKTEPVHHKTVSFQNDKSLP